MDPAARLRVMSQHSPFATMRRRSVHVPSYQFRCITNADGRWQNCWLVLGEDRTLPML